MKTVIILLVATLTMAVLAQPNPDTLWTRTYGGTGTDEARSIQLTTDDEYIIAGFTRSFGAYNYDIYFVKIDDSGDVIWTKQYGGYLNDYAYSIQQTFDEGYIIAGKTNSFGNGNYDMYLLKTDSNGDTVWTRTYGETGDEVAASALQTPDGGFILAGSENSTSGVSKAYLVKTDNSGSVLWDRSYSLYYSSFARSIEQTADNGFIITGRVGRYIEPQYVEYDLFLMKIDSIGNIMWYEYYGGWVPESGRSVEQTTDGGYIAAGYGGLGPMDIYLVRTDSEGSTLWTRNINLGYNDRAFDIDKTNDGCYVLTGVRGGTFFLMKIDDIGNDLWTSYYSDGDWAFSVEQTSDYGYIIAGTTVSQGAGGGDFYVVRTGPDEASSFPEEIAHSKPISLQLLNAYPNPFNSSTIISYFVSKVTVVKLNIYNLSGQKIETLENNLIEPGLHHTIWDADDLPSGTYFCRIETNDLIQTRKLLLLK